LEAEPLLSFLFTKTIDYGWHHKRAELVGDCGGCTERAQEFHEGIFDMKMALLIRNIII
jgi:hypothetical protein